MSADDRPYGHSLLPPATSAWVTALFAVSAVGVVFACWVMYKHRGTTFVKRKSWPLFMVSAAGILLVYISQVVYLWLYWEAVRGSGVAWWTGQSLYYVGFVLTFWTMMIRSWRIVCIFSPTIDIVASWPPLVRGGERDAKLRWNLLTMKWNNMFTQRRRAGKWAYTRVAVLTAPAFVITCVLLPAGLTDLAELLWTVYDFAAIFLFLVVAARLVSIRGLVTLEELVESRMLMLFSAAAVQYFVVDNILWFGIIRPLSPTDPHHTTYFWLFEVYQVVSFDILFACTTGWVAWVLLSSPNGEATATTNPLMRINTVSASSDNPSQSHRRSVISSVASDAPISEASTGDGTLTSQGATRGGRAVSAGGIGVQLTSVKAETSARSGGTMPPRPMASRERRHGHRSAASTNQ